MPAAPTPAPPVVPSDVLTDDQWRTLAALADTVVPALTPSVGTDDPLLRHALHHEDYDIAARHIADFADSSSATDDRIASFLAENATSQPDFRLLILQTLSLYIDNDKRKQLLGLLDALNNRALCLLLTGRATPFHALSIREREDVINSWRSSRFQTFRDIYGSITSLIKLCWLRTSPTLGHILGYPTIPESASPPSSSYAFEFVQFTGSDEPVVLETDVVIVGSGCGGAVAAKTLAEAGLRVIVVDKAYYWSPDKLPMAERDAAVNLYDNGGMHNADGGNVAVVAGSTWGGGGTVNWSASLIPQGFVRREWADKFGLPYFTSASFRSDLDAVCERMGVGTAAIEHNVGNSVLLEGAQRLGWNAKAVPQNTGGHKHYDGLCTLGCGSGQKQGPMVTFLPDAARAGAVFIEGLAVDEILFDPESPSNSRKTNGISGTWTSRPDSTNSPSQLIQRKVIIRAPTVISSAGSLRTPVLLRRSGLDNWHIGRHLHLHPVAFVGAVWDKPTNPWEGGILTSVVNDVENLDGEGYGAKLECVTMLPSWYLGLFPWLGGLHFKQSVAKMRHSTGYISLARDRYGGRVVPDPADPSRCRITYTPHAHDRKHILAGTVALAQILYVAGAREIQTSIPDIPSFTRSPSVSEPSLNDPDFQAWLLTLRHASLPANAALASAHQMGSCRMGTSPRNSAVDPRGAVWGTQGLYVCDTSVFPSASGVNPMITVMATARGIARGIAKEMMTGKAVVARL